MGCGCKSKKKVDDVVDNSEFNLLEKIQWIGRLTLISILVTLIMPVVWIMLLRMVYKSSKGDTLDVVAMVTKLLGKNKQDEESDLSGLDPDEFELVDVDKIK
jgi:hypothetical protein